MFVGITHKDVIADAEYLADKTAGLRIFRDEFGKMNLSLRDVGGSCLVVSQFTLYGDAKKGRRPSFISAAPPEIAVPIYEHFIEVLRSREKIFVETGEFGADMLVDISNDGPVTLMLESECMSKNGN